MYDHIRVWNSLDAASLKTYIYISKHVTQKSHGDFSVSAGCTLAEPLLLRLNSGNRAENPSLE